jgi:type I restriction enzyme S subunit
MNFTHTALSNILKIHYGKSLKSEERNHNGTVLVYGSNGLIGNHNEKLVTFPTIVVGRKGSVGEITYAPDGGWPIDTTFYIELINPSSVNLRYLFYALKQANLANQAIITAIPGLNRNDVYNTKIPLPPLEEQKRIAHILDLADNLRAKRQQALARLDALLQSTFLEMFGDFITHPIQTMQLSDIANVTSGVTKSQNRVKGKETVVVPYMRVANVQDGYILTDNENLKTIEVFPEDVEKYLT